MDLLLRDTGDDQPEGLHAGPHKRFKGTSLCRMLPSVFCKIHSHTACWVARWVSRLGYKPEMRIVMRPRDVRDWVFYKGVLRYPNILKLFNILFSIRHICS